MSDNVYLVKILLFLKKFTTIKLDHNYEVYMSAPITPQGQFRLDFIQAFAQGRDDDLLRTVRDSKVEDINYRIGVARSYIDFCRDAFPDRCSSLNKQLDTLAGRAKRAFVNDPNSSIDFIDNAEKERLEKDADFQKFMDLLDKAKTPAALSQIVKKSNYSTLKERGNLASRFLQKQYQKMKEALASLESFDEPGKKQVASSAATSSAAAATASAAASAAAATASAAAELDRKGAAAGSAAEVTDLQKKLGATKDEAVKILAIKRYLQKDDFRDRFHKDVVDQSNWDDCNQILLGIVRSNAGKTEQQLFELTEKALNESAYSGKNIIITVKMLHGLTFTIDGKTSWRIRDLKKSYIK